LPGDDLSTGVVVAISAGLTFVITTLITYTITSSYYKHLMVRLMKKSKADLKAIASDQCVSTRDIKVDPVDVGRANVKINSNPAYGIGTPTTMDTTNTRARPYAITDIIN